MKNTKYKMLDGTIENEIPKVPNNQNGQQQQPQQIPQTPTSVVRRYTRLS